MTQTLLHEDERGRLAAGGNELTMDSLIDDTPKYRMGAPEDRQSLGAHSGDVLQEGGRRVEKVLIQFKQDHDGAGLIWIGASDGLGDDDANMRVIAEMRYDKIEFKAPITAPGGVPGGPPTILISPGGTHWLVMQDDGNLVAYRGSAPHSADSVPVWSSWYGVIR